MNTRSQSVLGPPHVFTFVSELAAITEARFSAASEWDGRRVRVVGRLKEFHPTLHEARLESLRELDAAEGPPFSIEVNLMNVDISKISNNTIVSIIGEVYIKEECSTVIAKAIADFESLDLLQFADAIKIVRKRFPQIMK